MPTLKTLFVIYISYVPAQADENSIIMKNGILH